MVNLLNYAFYITVALLCILCFVVAFMYLKVVKARVQYKLAKEEFDKALAAQKAEYEAKGVNIYKANKSSSTQAEASSLASSDQSTSDSTSEDKATS